MFSINYGHVYFDFTLFLVFPTVSFRPFKVSSFPYTIQRRLYGEIKVFVLFLIEAASLSPFICSQFIKTKKKQKLSIL